MREPQNIILHPAKERGYVHHGWLTSYHSFSFGQYSDSSKVHFGVLRVLNDDTVAGGMGFGTHPHDNMEIITLPLAGILAHQDSMGNKGNITVGEIQVMSAGTGIRHSEYNASAEETVQFLQIWLFPNQKGVTPRYQQQAYTLTPNVLEQILSPDAEDKGVWIHQQAWFQVGNFEVGKQFSYSPKLASNGVYLFLIEGAITVNGHTLQQRDAIGLTPNQTLEINVSQNSTILIMDIPMEIN